MRRLRGRPGLSLIINLGCRRQRSHKRQPGGHLCNPLLAILEGGGARRDRERMLASIYIWRDGQYLPEVVYHTLDWGLRRLLSNGVSRPHRHGPTFGSMPVNGPRKGCHEAKGESREPPGLVSGDYRAEATDNCLNPITALPGRGGPVGPTRFRRCGWSVVIPACVR